MWAPAAEPAWRAQAFGLVIAGREEVAGLRASDAAPTEVDVTLERVAPDRVPGPLRDDGAELISDRRDEDGPALRIDAHPTDGWRLWGRGCGAAAISADGARVAYTPEAGAGRAWDRYLLAQVLPFVATVRSIEVLHAAAVVSAGRAIAVAGPSGAGKTTVARALCDLGAGWLTDDVLALTPAPGGVLAHPGPALASVRDDGQGLVPVDPHPEAVPLGSVCLLELDAPAEAVELHPIAPGDPRPLLAATYNLVLRGPQRLAAQLDVCSRIAAHAVVTRVRAPAGTSPEAVAAALLETCEAPA